AGARGGRQGVNEEDGRSEPAREGQGGGGISPCGQGEVTNGTRHQRLEFDPRGSPGRGLCVSRASRWPRRRIVVAFIESTLHQSGQDGPVRKISERCAECPCGPREIADEHAWWITPGGTEGGPPVDVPDGLQRLRGQLAPRHVWAGVEKAGLFCEEMEAARASRVSTVSTSRATSSSSPRLKASMLFARGPCNSTYDSGALRGQGADASGIGLSRMGVSMPCLLCRFDYRRQKWRWKRAPM